MASGAICLSLERHSEVKFRANGLCSKVLTVHHGQTKSMIFNLVKLKFICVCCTVKSLDGARLYCIIHVALHNTIMGFFFFFLIMTLVTY